MRRGVHAAALGLAGLAVAPAPASAHGLVQRADLPIPEWLFGWAAGLVLIVSFVALGVLWPKPKLEQAGWRPLPGGRLMGSPALEVVSGAIGVFLLALVIVSGIAGEQVPTSNLAPTFVYVTFWVGLVPVSVLFGDVFRAFNPWRAIGRASGALMGALGRERRPAEYPPRLGRWPAALGLLAFTWMELASGSGETPRNVAIATLVYTGLTFAGMARWGTEPWIARGEAFGVYFNLFSRISPLEVRERTLGLRPPLSGLTRLEPLPGTVALLAVMIGTVTFDGFSAGSIWGDVQPELARLVESLGFSIAGATELARGAGLIGCVAAVMAFYALGVAGARSVGGGLDADRLRSAFIHSLVPIAVAYVGAHYLTLLVFQGQAMGYLVSDPLGSGADIFGTADAAIDYSVIGQNDTWYAQVGLVVTGHIAGLTLAHDRALSVYERAKLAVRSQYWMLAVMVGFTTLALWLLASANS